jgi:hypothetical protein
VEGWSGKFITPLALLWVILHKANVSIPGYLPTCLKHEFVGVTYLILTLYLLFCTSQDIEITPLVVSNEPVTVTMPDEIFYHRQIRIASVNTIHQSSRPSYYLLHVSEQFSALKPLSVSPEDRNKRSKLQL